MFLWVSHVTERLCPFKSISHGGSPLPPISVLERDAKAFQRRAARATRKV